MLLTNFNICHYLLDKGLISAASIVNGDFTVRMTTSRNNNFTINQEWDNALFVKQPRTFEEDRIQSLRSEATCYWLANNDPEFETLKGFLPPYFGYDTKNHILTMSFLSGTMDLETFYHTHRQFPIAIAQKQAEVLASFHQNIFEKIKDKESSKLFKQGLPMVFFMVGKGRNQAWLEDRTPRVQQMMRLITDDPEYVALIEKVKDDWAMESLIHGDIKNTNFLVNTDGVETGQYELRLLDWEIADLGDPMWDVAALLQSYLLPWVFAETVDKSPAYRQTGRTVGFDLKLTQPCIRAFWKNYIALMDFSEEEASQKLLKATRFCALKLIHSCLESSQYTEDLPPQSAMMLQLSLNILKSPEAAITTLFELETIPAL